MSARDDLREAELRKKVHLNVIQTNGLKASVDRIMAIIASERDAALREAIPRIEAETREACAKVADEYGPSRPMAANMAFSVIRGRWEGEQAASANIAAAIRNQEPKL